MKAADDFRDHLRICTPCRELAFRMCGLGTKLLKDAGAALRFARTGKYYS